MANTKKKSLSQSEIYTRQQKISQKIGNYKLIDIKKACIIRGIDFDDLVNKSVPDQCNWLVANWDNPINRDLLETFDDYVDEHMASKGYAEDDPLRLYRLSTSVSEDEEGDEKLKMKTKNKKLGIKVVKKKKLRNTQFGIFSGTKKEYTYTLTRDLHEKKPDMDSNTLKKVYSNRMIERVQKKYPEAQPKSIKIWFSRALKELRG